MVIINNSDEKQEVAVSRFKENTQQYSTGKDVISGQTINIKNNISIEAKSALILELQH
jgi:predicted GTPase